MAFFHGFDDKIQKDAFGCYGHTKKSGYYMSRESCKLLILGLRFCPEGFDTS